MDTAKTYIIKGMVCNRCITALQSSLQQHDLIVNNITLGKVGVNERRGDFDERLFATIVSSLGFSLGTDKHNRVVENVKAIIKHYFDQFDPLESKKRFSDLLSDALNMSYDNISSIFSAHEKITIETYIITYRIDLVKQFLSGSDLTLTEIAYRTGFSSIHHLSKQFKQTTGISPTEFRLQIAKSSK
jgi:AraC-like DNA-binding protein